MAGETVVDELIPLWDRTVTFCGLYEGHLHSFHYQAASEKIALTSPDTRGREFGEDSSRVGGIRDRG